MMLSQDELLSSTLFGVALCVDPQKAEKGVANMDGSVQSMWFHDDEDLQLFKERLKNDPSTVVKTW